MPQAPGPQKNAAKINKENAAKKSAEKKGKKNAEKKDKTETTIDDIKKMVAEERRRKENEPINAVRNEPIDAPATASSCEAAESGETSDSPLMRRVPKLPKENWHAGNDQGATSRAKDHQGHAGAGSEARADGRGTPATRHPAPACCEDGRGIAAAKCFESAADDEEARATREWEAMKSGSPEARAEMERRREAKTGLATAEVGPGPLETVIGPSSETRHRPI